MPKIALLIGLTLPMLALAQSGTSAISGSVKDPSGAPIPIAKIKVANQDTGFEAVTSSNDSGIYRVGSLVPGTYRIEAEVDGFEKLVRSPLTLQVGQILNVDLTLAVGKQSEIVTVTEAGPVTESQSSNVAQVVNRQMLAGLPLPNRAASSL